MPGKGAGLPCRGVKHAQAGVAAPALLLPASFGCPPLDQPPYCLHCGPQHSAAPRTLPQDPYHDLGQAMGLSFSVPQVGRCGMGRQGEGGCELKMRQH